MIVDEGAMASAARIRALLADLVALDTANPPGRENAIADCMAAELSRIGYRTDVVPFGPGRANVVARLENGPGPVLAFSSHLDTVPAGEGWTRDPFSLGEENGVLYGRGTCDAKGSIAAMTEGLRELSATRAAWRGTVLAVFVGDEEVASLGARHFVETSGAGIDWVVIGEPTDNRVVCAHKGVVRPVVRVHGVSAHSGTPDRGVNAIQKAGRLLDLCAGLDADLRRRIHPLVGAPSLTPTRIHGGEAENVVPDICDLVFDRRTVPGEDHEEVRRELEQLLDRAAASGVEATVLEYRRTSGPAETPADDPFVRLACDVVRRHGVGEPGPLGFEGGCDLVHFRSCGAGGIVLGPGSLSVAHKPDEHVALAELVSASRIYRDIALRALGSHDGDSAIVR